MIIIDSSFWIEFFLGSKYGEIVRKLFIEEKNVIVPTIIITEVYKKFLGDSTQELAQTILDFLLDLKTIDLNVELSIQAAKTGKINKLSLADSIIYATTINSNSTLYTMDKHFKELPNVIYYEKV